MIRTRFSFYQSKCYGFYATWLVILVLNNLLVLIYFFRMLPKDHKIMEEIWKVTLPNSLTRASSAIAFWTEPAQAILSVSYSIDNLTTLTVRKFFLISFLNLLSCDFRLLILLGLHSYRELVCSFYRTIQ